MTKLLLLIVGLLLSSSTEASRSVGALKKSIMARSAAKTFLGAINKCQGNRGCDRGCASQCVGKDDSGSVKQDNACGAAAFDDGACVCNGVPCNDDGGETDCDCCDGDDLCPPDPDKINSGDCNSACTGMSDNGSAEEDNRCDGDITDDGACTCNGGIACNDDGGGTDCDCCDGNDVCPGTVQGCGGSFTPPATGSTGDQLLATLNKAGNDMLTSQFVGKPVDLPEGGSFTMAGANLEFNIVTSAPATALTGNLGTYELSACITIDGVSATGLGVYDLPLNIKDATVSSFPISAIIDVSGSIKLSGFSGSCEMKDVQIGQPGHITASSTLGLVNIASQASIVNRLWDKITPGITTSLTEKVNAMCENLGR